MEFLINIKILDYNLLYMNGLC